MTSPVRSFAQLDAAILSEIAAGNDTFTHLLQQASVLKLATPFVTQRSDRSRVVDRRLQALRKASKILYMKGKWAVTDSGCQV